MLEPNPRVMKKVAAFMYGNNVRLSDAVACYNACNGRHQNRVERVLKTWYDVSNRDEDSKHMEEYYSMSVKCQEWINGKAHEQYEAVKTVVSVSEFGPPRTRYPGQIARMTESIRSVVNSRRHVATAGYPPWILLQSWKKTWAASILGPAHSKLLHLTTLNTQVDMCTSHRSSLLNIHPGCTPS